jgi:hypothetical protein
MYDPSVSFIGGCVRRLLAFNPSFYGFRTTILSNDLITVWELPSF